MIAYYGSTISKHMTQTPEGFLICRDVPIARIGTQDYLARELGLDGEPDRPVTVERRPEACLGCGMEHDCSVHGCAVINKAVDLLRGDVR